MFTEKPLKHLQTQLQKTQASILYITRMLMTVQERETQLQHCQPAGQSHHHIKFLNPILHSDLSALEVCMIWKELPDTLLSIKKLSVKQNAYFIN